MHQGITLGFSPCPNDTFIFYAVSCGKVTLHEMEVRAIIKDVEELNNLVLKGGLDVSKVSIHTLGYILDKYVLLDSGAALGEGCGPLLVSKGKRIDEISQVAVPGLHTTAVLLLKIFYPHIRDMVVMGYHEIIEAVAMGKAEAGLIIHEGRFTYPSYGLSLLADLGEEWKRSTGLPIPLGGIVAKRSLGREGILAIQGAISQGLEYSEAHMDEVWPFIKAHAQEMRDDVIRRHICLYVNRYTYSLGEVGREAILRLMEMAGGRGMIPTMQHSPFLG